MEVNVTSNMDTVLDLPPYNNHTVRCNVSHESFARISGTLIYSFINEDGSVRNESKGISGPGPIIALSNVSETSAGQSRHVCNVTLLVDDKVINSTTDGTFVKVVGPNPPAVPMLTILSTSTTTATVSWTVPEVTYTPENYTVRYAPYDSCPTSGSDLEVLNSSITVYTRDNHTLTDFFSAMDVEFSVNLIGLMPATNYCCFVLAMNTNGTTMSEVISLETKAAVPLLVIAAVGALVALVICFLILVCCCVCCNKRSKKYKVITRKIKLDSKISGRDAGAMELQLTGTDTQFEIFNYPVGQAISVDEFPGFVKKKGKEGLEREYDELQNFDFKSHEISLIDENRPKDRFQNIYPFDDNLVTLKLLPVDDNSDYINASHVVNYKQVRAYVAAQGPLPHTVDDFWRMVWEYELPTIVMLTQLEESGKDKCACYWPEDGSDMIYFENELELKLVKQTVSPLFVTRKFILNKTNDHTCSPLSVTQYHFTAWPDHGVPDDKTCITTFISSVRKKHPPSGPPLLVHCSAGVGRTGTFIVLDTMLQRMKAEGTIDIQGYVNQIRNNRVKMVQTLMQYVYIHESLAEYLVCGDTSFAVMNARIHIHNMGAVENRETGFQKQFELLQELGLAPVDPSMSDGEAYPEKNRYSYNLPYDLNRVRLRVLDNDYINASWVNGYKRRGAFLATQAPLKETVQDFWRMVWENQSRAIVMLCLTEEGDECERKRVSCQYWPNEVKEKKTFGTYEITLVSEQPDDDYIIRNLTVTRLDNNQSTTVTQYHYQQWPEGGKPKETASVLRMIADLVKTQSSTGNKGITVMCNNGVGRTGAFISIYSQLERVKTEATADIFQFVKSSRLQRAGLVRSLDEFVFCYEVVADYNDDMSLYDNFKYVV